MFAVCFPNTQIQQHSTTQDMCAYLEWTLVRICECANAFGRCWARRRVARLSLWMWCGFWGERKRSRNLSQNFLCINLFECSRNVCILYREVFVEFGKYIVCVCVVVCAKTCIVGCGGEKIQYLCTFVIVLCMLMLFIFKWNDVQ